DWSNAAFFLVAGALNGPLSCSGLQSDSKQGDKRIIQELKRFGSKVSENEGAVLVEPGTLAGSDVDMSEIPDLLPILAVLACFARGSSHFYNAARLRIKESDRLNAVKNMIVALGGKAEEKQDSLTVHGQHELRGGVVDGCRDHRIVMAAAIAATRCRQNVQIINAEAVRKSYPDFFQVYSSIGGIVKNGV
ncbi:MAG: 3-phosphoshikimate 1-carboxyvinyltransferase, partial [Lentisphaerae bacterium]|nr:3-phosphoshikimate 1-carboxyvinyltransferase [Lentisphaerota bacterium]